MPEENGETITPEISLLRTIGSSDLGDTGIDAGELALDLLLKDGLLREIPVFNMLVGFAKAGRAIKDYLFVKKLYRFLRDLEDIPIQDREQFVNKLERKKQGQRIGENLLLFLDRYDHLDKACLLSKLFKAYLKEEIDFGEFLRFSTSVDRAFIGDLRNLLSYFSAQKTETETLWENLYSSGLSKMVINADTDQRIVVSYSTYPDELITFTFNSEAARFAMIILDNRFVHPQGWFWDAERKNWTPYP
jgi:hypothetical protein